MFLTAMALLAVGPPDVGLELHRARVSGDEAYRELLESQLQARRRRHHALVAVLLSGGVVLIITAFVIMRPTPPRQER